MTIAFVGQAVANSTSSTIGSASYSSTAGNLLVLVVQHSAATISGVTDSASQTWLKAADSGSSGATGDALIGIWYMQNSAAVTSVTATGSTSGNMNLNVSEYSGVKTTSAKHNQDWNVFTSTTSGSTPLTLTAGDVIICAIGYTTAVAGTRQDTMTGGLTPLTVENNGTTQLVAGYLVSAGGGSTGATWTFSAGHTFGEASASFFTASTGTAATASGTVSFTGSGAATGAAAASGAASFTGSGSAGGAASATGAVSFSGDSPYGLGPYGQGNYGTGIEGAAAASASGSFAFAGTAAGRTQNPATAAGTFALGGSGTGGGGAAAAGGLTFTGTASTGPGIALPIRVTGSTSVLVTVTSGAAAVSAVYGAGLYGTGQYSGAALPIVVSGSTSQLVSVTGGVS